MITTPFSFVASANCILYLGATPVFAGIDPLTLNLDPERVRAAITSNTRALLPVHAFSQPCAMDRLCGIARRHHLVVIEDACEALGAEIHGQKAGTFGACGVFAFYPNKQMTTGESGMLVIDDARWDWDALSAACATRDAMVARTAAAPGSITCAWATTTGWTS